MKASLVKSGSHGFTVIELLVVIALFAVLMAMLLPARNNQPRGAYRAVCMSNLRQIDIAFIMYASDHAEKFPMQTLLPNGETQASADSDHAFPYFEKVHPYLPGVQFYKILVCPVDHARQVATNNEQLSDLNISYFLNVDAQFTNQPTKTILSGDRNLTSPGQMVKPGWFVVTTNRDMNWSRDLHIGGGNLAFADGHVQWCKTNSLNSFFASQPLATNRLLVP